MMWNGSRAAWSTREYPVKVPTSFRPKVPDDDDGLPPLAEGSRVNVKGHIATSHVVTSIEDLGDHGSFVSSEGMRLPSVQDVRHLIARHDRERGCYWADRLRELASEMRDPERRDSCECLECAWSRRILALLADLRAQGVC